MKIEKDSDGPCERCGKRPGALTWDPYMEDVHDEYVARVLCEQCVEELCDEI